MALLARSEAHQKYINEALGYDDVKIKDQMEHIKKWLKTQPHLPHIPDTMADRLAHAFLTGSKLRLEEAKSKIDMYYSMRHHLPEVFVDRDPCLPEVRDSVDVIRFFPVSELTPEGVRVSVLSFNPHLMGKFTARHLVGLYRRVIAIVDARIHLLEDMCQGEYLVVDCQGLSASHVKVVPWSLITRFPIFTQKGLPSRILGVYVINAPPIADVIITAIKAGLKRLKNMMHTFQGGYSNLYPYIPQRILPKDYEGEQPSIEEQSRAWQRSIESWRDFYLEEQQRLTDEHKREKHAVVSDSNEFGMSGSFTKLAIDEI